jgi:hypothetical protein
MTETNYEFRSSTGDRTGFAMVSNFAPLPGHFPAEPSNVPHDAFSECWRLMWPACAGANGFLALPERLASDAASA